LITLPDHPFRTLPDGYATYNATDAALAGGVRQDVERARHGYFYADCLTFILGRVQY